MTQVKLRIGSHTFSISPKDELGFDFGRHIATIDTIGDPTYQDVGADDKTLEFSGAFVGHDAWAQAELLESMMDAASAVQLVYGPIQRSVRIHKFSPKVKRFDYVLYDITLLIVPSGATFQTQGATSIVSSPPAQSNSPPVSSVSAIAQYADKTVTVKQGQTLWGIASAEYGRGDLWPIIAKVNGVKDETSLQAGQKLKIPSKANVQSALTAYNNRLNAVITPAGISYLQALEAKA